MRREERRVADDDLIRRARALGYTVDDRVDGPLQLLLDIHGAAAGTFRARRTIAVSSSLDPTLARATLPHEVGHAEQDRDGTWYTTAPTPSSSSPRRWTRMSGPSAWAGPPRPSGRSSGPTTWGIHGAAGPGGDGEELTAVPAGCWATRIRREAAPRARGGPPAAPR